VSNYLKQLRTCGQNVTIAEDAFIEHPEAVELGDNVTLMSGFHLLGRPRECRVGANVTFYPNCFVQGAGRLVVDEHVEFFPGTYISIGKWESSFVEIGHHCHFAPNCVLYGWGGLRLGAYCNIAAHTVFATVGHHDEITDRPMSLTGEKAGPITLEDDVWVAANVTIAANTRIAHGCVIGANAVVTRDTEPMGLYVGVPARRLRDR
jgi:acetyltransferase-like isoleucine patch superfamily enzyme